MEVSGSRLSRTRRLTNGAREACIIDSWQPGQTAELGLGGLGRKARSIGFLTPRDVLATTNQALGRSNDPDSRGNPVILWISCIGTIEYT